MMKHLTFGKGSDEYVEIIYLLGSGIWRQFRDLDLVTSHGEPVTPANISNFKVTVGWGRHRFQWLLYLLMMEVDV